MPDFSDTLRDKLPRMILVQVQTTEYGRVCIFKLQMRESFSRDDNHLYLNHVLIDVIHAFSTFSTTAT